MLLINNEGKSYKDSVLIVYYSIEAEERLFIYINLINAVEKEQLLIMPQQVEYMIQSKEEIL